METVATALERGAKRLKEIAKEASRREAKILLKAALDSVGESPNFLLNRDAKLPEGIISKLDAFLSARAEGQPISQIVGKRAFWRWEFCVSPDVLDPRPDTETLIEAVLDEHSFSTVLDLGTGSGCILISLLKERPSASGVGCDISEAALELAQKNADMHDLSSFRFVKSDWFDAIDGAFDLIVSNPPYISESEMEALDENVKKWEPEFALTPGGDGLDAYRKIAKEAGNYLTEEGLLALEIGYSQANDVVALLEQAGFRDIFVHQDINHKDRVVLAKKP